MNMYYSQDDVKGFGRILGIWAHPDDESWTSAGLMRMAALNGQELAIITATKGDAGNTSDEKRWPKKDLAEIRTQELHECLCEIGEVQQFWLGCNDGEMHSENHDQMASEISNIINEFQPDTIVTFEPGGITGHGDHKTIQEWAVTGAKSENFSGQILCAITSSEVYEKAGKNLDFEFNIFFNTDTPNLVDEDDADVCIKLPEDILECKICCLKKHQSQTSHIFNSSEGKEAIKFLSATECFTLFQGQTLE